MNRKSEVTLEHTDHFNDLDHFISVSAV